MELSLPKKVEILRLIKSTNFNLEHHMYMDKRVILKELLLANKENPIRAAKLIIDIEENEKRSEELAIANVEE